jgi:glyoxylase-like metal-dependent hydrolase (beta-lactamase superfamily II)
MSLYEQLRENPPTFVVDPSPHDSVNEIKIDLVSVMCDNKYRWIAKKNDNGKFIIDTGRFAYMNFGIPCYIDDLEWAMDAGNWDIVFETINEGTVKVHKIQYR